MVGPGELVCCAAPGRSLEMTVEVVVDATGTGEMEMFTCGVFTLDNNATCFNCDVGNSEISNLDLEAAAADDGGIFNLILEPK